MPLNLPDSARDVSQQIKTDVQRQLPNTDPFQQNSITGALATGNGNYIFDFYQQLNVLQNLLIPDTSQDEILERWAAIYGLQRLAATQATGNVVVNGTAGAFIPSGTFLTAANGQRYEVTQTSTVIVNNINITSITRVGNVATVVTATPHNLAANTPIIISGADQPEYNVNTTVPVSNVLSTTSFTYEVNGNPVTPATGTLLLRHNSILTPVRSENFQNTSENVLVNLSAGSSLNLQSPIVNINSSIMVGAVPVGGGSDQETNAELRVRLLNRIQNPVAHFNVADIEEIARTVAGVTRVFVEEVTPAVGQVTVYFMRDNDSDPIPDVNEVAAVKNVILTIKPANTSSDDVIVNAPTPVTTNFVFSSLDPNTTTMQSAIRANLQQFFAEETEVGVTVQQDAYRSAIQNTIDTETGDRVVDFTLSSPLGNINASAGQIVTLGTVNFS